MGKAGGFRWHSLPSQKQIEHKTPPGVGLWPPAVRQNAFLAAARLFEGIGEDGHVRKLPLLVDGVREPAESRRPPRRRDRHGLDPVPEQVADEMAHHLTPLGLL